MNKQELLDKIASRDLVCGTVGLGYVGLPLAVEKAKAGFKTVGIDVQAEKVDMVNRGENYIGDVVNEDLQQLVNDNMIEATTDFSRIGECDFVAICVPTPLDVHQQPDTSYMESSAKAIAPYLKKGVMVVLESTTYPGTTEELIRPILEEGSGMTCGEDFYLGFSPERVDPGNLIYKTSNTPKVVGAIGADAVKIGMLHPSELIRAVRETLAAYDIRNIVLVPVMVATSGDRLLQEEAIATLQEELVPFVRVITPNIPEAEILLGRKIAGQEELPQVARELSFGRKVSVLLKAGHLHDTELIDVFYNAETDKATPLRSMRLDTPNTHGTGCTLSSAVAAFLAHGLPLDEAVVCAKEYINAAIIAGAEYEIGKGHGPVHHFFNFWE